MALPCKFLFSSATCSTTSTRRHKNHHRCCSAIAIDSPSSVGGVVGIRWGSTKLQGPREEMEDDVVLRSDSLNGFSFAAVFDGHGGFSSVKFLRDELYKECLAALQGGLLLSSRDFSVVRDAIQKAFVETDSKLSNWLEETCKEDESGSTATVIFLGENLLIISHVGDSSVVISRSGKAEVLTSPHRPYGNNKVSLDEIRRIRQAGGWVCFPVLFCILSSPKLHLHQIVNGRICGDISISRAFGDVRFKTKKNEMLEKGVKEGRWTKKFVSRLQFNGDLLTATPDIYQVALGSDAEFILLASDGLWDYMSSSDAVTFVRNQLRQHGDVQVACEALAHTALDRRSQDNISIVIADFGRTDWQKVPQQQQNFVYEASQAFATVGIVSLGIWISSFLFM